MMAHGIVNTCLLQDSILVLYTRAREHCTPCHTQKAPHSGAGRPIGLRLVCHQHRAHANASFTLSSATGRNGLRSSPPARRRMSRAVIERRCPLIDVGNRQPTPHVAEQIREIFGFSITQPRRRGGQCGLLDALSDRSCCGQRTGMRPRHGMRARHGALEPTTSSLGCGGCADNLAPHSQTD